MPWCLESCSPAACWLPESPRTGPLRRNPHRQGMRGVPPPAMQEIPRSSPPYTRRPLRAKWSCHRKAEVQKVDLPGSCLHDPGRCQCVFFIWFIYLGGKGTNIICKLMALLACVHLYPKMISPHRHMCTTFNHSGATLTSCCMYMYMANYWSVFVRWTPASMWLWNYVWENVTYRVCVCRCVCVYARTCEGESSDLELVLHRYSSLIDWF